MGNPRAKARLVLQGFSDPDLLRGELDTSSPTLSRSSRQILLANLQILAYFSFLMLRQPFFKAIHRSEFCGPEFPKTLAS